MPYHYVEPDVFLEHGGVTVYCTYNGSPDPWKFWFTTDPDNADESHAHGENHHFDARMFAGKWASTPNVGEWEQYWRPRFRTEDECVEALVRSAIDEGRITSPVSVNAPTESA